MSTTQDSSNSVEEERLAKLKRDLEGYRELLLPVNKVLEWEQSWYPMAMVGAITFLFALLWYLEPSVLTTFSLIGLYLLVMMGIFTIMAWIGSLIDNLLLTYLLAVFVALLPGLRRHGIIQKVTNEVSAAVKKVLSKQDKPKAN